MILKREIERIAEQKGVTKTTIDKDWILGHFVDAIFSIPECRDKLAYLQLPEKGALSTLFQSLLNQLMTRETTGCRFGY